MEELEDTSLLHLNATFLQGFPQANTYEERINYLRPILQPAINRNHVIAETRGMKLSSQDNFKKESSSIGLRKEGNSFYQTKEFERALTFYTLSAAAAPQGSESLALAFANRSAVLSSMGKNAECLADIGRALSHGYPPELRHKLWLRAAQSHRELGQTERAAENFLQAELSLEESVLSEEQKSAVQDKIRRERNVKCRIVETVKSSCPEMPELSYKQNEEIPNASDAVKIEWTKKLGRHLVATREIKTGDVLLVERPFAAVLEAECRWSHCSHCLTRSLALLPCPACDWALYCSESCRESARTYHAAECEVVSRYCFVLGGPGFQYVLLLVRIVCTVGVANLAAFTAHVEEEQRRQGFNTERRYLSSDFNSIYNLVSHFKDRSVKESVQDCVEVLNVLKCFQLPENINENKFAGILLKILTSLYVNVHGMVEMQLNSPYLHEDGHVQLNQVGVGLFPAGSLANHSCDPNVFVTYHGSTRVVRAARPITRGEHITDNYGKVFTTDPLSTRQSYLQGRYHFVCSCDACVNEWPEIEELPSKPQFTLAEGDVETEVRRCEEEFARVDKGTMTKKNELHILENYFSLLSKQSKRLNQTYLFLQQDIFNYYRSLGNYHISY